LQQDIVDDCKSPVPGLSAAKVNAAVSNEKARLESSGYSVKSLYVDDGETAEDTLTEN
jgi:hypothetical protein